VRALGYAELSHSITDYTLRITRSASGLQKRRELGKREPVICLYTTLSIVSCANEVQNIGFRKRSCPYRYRPRVQENLARCRYYGTISRVPSSHVWRARWQLGVSDDANLPCQAVMLDMFFAMLSTTQGLIVWCCSTLLDFFSSVSRL
jgi:hypothetical protein